MSKKQTAVEWLATEILKLEGIQTVAIPDNLFNIAKQKEREQIEEAYNESNRDWLGYPNGSDYYTQTYGECTHKS